MDISYFEAILKKNRINLERVCFNDNVKDDIFCVLENYHRIEVFYRERGSRFDFKTFFSQEEAAEYLLEIMKYCKVSSNY